MQGLPVLLGDEDDFSMSCKDNDTNFRVNQRSASSESENDACSEVEALDTNTGLCRLTNDGVSSDSDSDDSEKYEPDRRTHIASKNSKYYTGKIPLAQSDDAYLLQEPLPFVRKECLEAYSATSNDVLSCPNACIEGQVGIRCKFCSQAKSSISELDYLTYPSSVHEINDAVKMIIKNHLRRCPFMPKKFRNILESKRTPLRNFRHENNQYWIDAAKESGMSDWHDGTIRFFRDPNTKGAAERLFLSFDKEEIWEKPLSVVKSDRKPISDYLFFLLSQVQGDNAATDIVVVSISLTASILMPFSNTPIKAELGLIE
jgi:hypothetical protein